MRILVLTIHYWPEQTGIGAVLTRRCEYLAAAGHEVTVCTAMPYYPEWRTHAAYRGKFCCSEDRNGVAIRRSWIYVPNQVNSAKRVLLEGSFLATSLLPALKSGKPDILLVVSPPLGLGLSAVLLSRWLKIPYVFDVQDLQPDTAADLGMLPPGMLPALYRLEAMAYRKATLITTVTEGMRQKIVEKGIALQKVAVVPPPADHDLFGVGRTVDGEAFRKKYGLEGKFIVAHSGNMGVKQGLGLVVEAAARLRHQPAIRFLLAGDGVMKSSLQSRALALGLNNLTFVPLQGKTEFLQMLAAIDLALIIQQSSVTDIVFPSKTVTLMSAGRAVVAAVSEHSEVARVIRQAEAGVVTEPENADSLVENIIEELFADSQRREEMSACARAYALRHWDEGSVLSNFESHLLSVAGVPQTEMAEQPAA